MNRVSPAQVESQFQDLGLEDVEATSTAAEATAAGEADDLEPTAAGGVNFSDTEKLHKWKYIYLWPYVSSPCVC